MKVVLKLMLASILTLTANSAWSMSADRCISTWERTVKKYNQSVKDLNRGWKMLTSDHDRAFDYFNDASSRLSFVNFGSCYNKTTITDDMADELNDSMDSIEKDAKCGMETTRLINWQEKMNDSIDDNEDKHSMYATAQTLYNIAHEIEYEYYCEDNVGVLGHAKDMKKWSNKIMKQLK